ncbi:FixH family protein (plasmid) [Rhizobium sp. CB3060]|uniref:FixH family protein n=1 Tax=Rhizobium sp. CB3060 TaxID=3138255 RepID=UPI0021A877CB|nr:FixH family protein [Rhizobium tropici]UWU24255.1 FixH family protein [Rhizobium tropici]
MTLFTLKPAAIAALIGLTFTGLTSQAWAQVQDYEFQLVKNEIKAGNAAEIAVRLVDKRSGKLVPDAVIFAQRVDMAPDGMEMMAEPIEALPTVEPGVYRFKAQIPMAGGWRLSLGAKVQGETDSLENKLEFKAVP